jgi:hypothetical protein
MEANSIIATQSIVARSERQWLKAAGFSIHAIDSEAVAALVG